jgi:hypothetical protein
MADEIVARIKAETPRRKGPDVVVAIGTFAAGIVGNFAFSKIEIAVVFWFLTLVAIGDLVSLYVGTKLVGKFAIVAVVVGVGFFLSHSWIYDQYQSQHAALPSGVLVTPSDGKDHSTEPPILEIGDGDAYFVWVGNQDSPLFHFWHDKLRIRRDGNRILVSITVKDSQGNLIVEIKDNAWTVSKTGLWDKNYTDNSLEVKDARGRIVLQLRLLPDRVQFQLELPNQGDFKIVEQGKYSDDDGIVPRFKYPSKDHWGELDDENYRIVAPPIFRPR